MYKGKPHLHPLTCCNVSFPLSARTKAFSVPSAARAFAMKSLKKIMSEHIEAAYSCILYFLLRTFPIEYFRNGYASLEQIH